MENTEAKVAELEAQIKTITAENDRLAKLAEPAERKSTYAEDHRPNLNTKFGKSQISPETKAFVKWMVTGQQTPEFKVLTNANSGALAPDEFRNIILEKLTRESVVRAAGATVIPMGSDTLTIPAGAATVTTSWTAEGALIPLSDPTWTTLQLVAKKLAARTSISSELEQDSFLDVADYVANAIANAMRAEEDAKFIAGLSPSATTPSGITTATITAVAQTGVNFGYDDALRLYLAVPPQYRKAASFAFLFSDADYGTLVGLTNTQGTPLFQSSMSGEVGATLFGKPVITSADVTAGTAYAGPMASYVIGDRRKITVARTDDGAGAFEYDLTMVKATERVDGVLALPESWRKLTGVAA